MEHPVRSLAMAGAASYPAALVMLFASLGLIAASTGTRITADTPTETEVLVAVAAWGALNVVGPSLVLRRPVRGPLLVALGAAGQVAGLLAAFATGLPPATWGIFLGAVVSGLVLGAARPLCAPVVAAASGLGFLTAYGLSTAAGGEGPAMFVAFFVGMAVWGAMVGAALGAAEALAAR